LKLRGENPKIEEAVEEEGLDNPQGIRRSNKAVN
jgi:hypothetical protein